MFTKCQERLHCRIILARYMMLYVMAHIAKSNSKLMLGLLSDTLADVGLRFPEQVTSLNPDEGFTNGCSPLPP